MSGDQRKRWTLVAATLGLSVTILDETVVFLALPAIDRDLGIGLSGQQWVVNGYLLTLSALLLIGGALADLFGRKRFFLIGLGGFGAASLAAALSPSGGFLIGARLAQGLFAALVMPTTLAILTATFRGEERGAAIGNWAAWSGLAAAIGPLVGGLLIGALSWRWIFILSLPIVAAAGAIGGRTIEESRDEEMDRSRLDLVGGLLAILALGGLTFSLIQGPEVGWTTTGVIVAGILAVAAFVAFLRQERRARSPMLPLDVFRSRNFSAANGATLALYGVFNGNFFILLIYLQTALDYTPLAAGAATLPLTLLMLGLSSRVGRVSERIGARKPMTAGMLLTTAGLALLSFVEPQDGYVHSVLPGVLVFGIGLALTVAPLTNTAMSAVPEDKAGLASGVNNAAARTAALLAVAALGLVFAVAFRASLPPTEQLPAAAQPVVETARERPTSALDLSLPQGVRAELRPELQDASVVAFRWAMWAGALVALVGAAVSFAGVRDRGDTEPVTAVAAQLISGRGLGSPDR